ncbi:hypothetical protein FRC04_002140 [Tulasnella sp. 424]|nr:hypothetical protein FRC04_002140 [Tulasnella sp. 424]KAG8961777.1 hypothetical protein FRC05_005803 [Tulasnella sp. 425]
MASSSSPTSQELEAQLDKIRCNMDSGVPSQKAQAVLLNALESTLAQQATQRTPVAYFAALFTTLDGAIKREPNLSEASFSEGAIIPATLYLLAVVLPTVPTTVLRSHLNPLLDTLVPLFPTLASQPAPLSHLIAVFASVFPHLEAAQFSTPRLRQSFVSILELALDTRQKVRRKAQDALKEILGSPPTPMVRHPYIEQTANYILGVLEAVENRSISKKIDGAVDTGVWCCGLLLSISDVWPEDHLSSLVTVVLKLPRLSSPLLTAQAFNVLTALLKAPKFSSAAVSVPIIVQTVIQSPPPEVVPRVPEAWLEVVENAMVAYGRSDPDGCSDALKIIWGETWVWLKAERASTRVAAEKALGAMCRYCINTSTINHAVQAALMGGEEDAAKTTLGSIIVELTQSLDSLPYMDAVPHILSVLSRLILRLRQRTSIPSSYDPRPMTAAEILLSDIIKQIGDLRGSPQFEFGERADDVIGSAIKVMGPGAFLEILPLNLLPSDLATSVDGRGRAYLLPLLIEHITNTSLQHFIDYFVPLSESLFELRSQAENAGKMVEVKIWEACIEQVWSCFKGYCEACVDVPAAFDPTFAQLLTNVLYNQTTLRPQVFTGLRSLVQTTKTLATSAIPAEQMESTFGISSAHAAESLGVLKQMAGDMLSVLFNVYSDVPVDKRDVVGEVIFLWLSIASSEEILTTYNKVASLLRDTLLVSPPTPASLSNCHTMLDLVNIMIPLVQPSTAQELLGYVLAADTSLLENSDTTTQKKSYRILSNIVSSGKGLRGALPEDFNRVLERLESAGQRSLSGAKHDRLRFLREVIKLMPQASLFHIPLVLPEVVLATKEFNEKARSEAFDCLVEMGEKIKAGGSLIPAVDSQKMDEGEAGRATIEAYLKLAASGMAGKSPHMISAAVTAVTRILFEFKDSVSSEMQSEITSTVLVFLASTNREIVKSALGYFKVAISSLPPSAVVPHLAKLVPALLAWTHDKKNPFKTLVLRVFSQMIKRYGFEPVWEASSGNDNAAVLTYVRKRSEKARKKKLAKAKQAEEEGESDEPQPRVSTGNAFEDVLYGSDSDSSDGESEAGQRRKNKNGVSSAATKAKQREPRIRVDDDVPLDLMHGTTAHISTATGVKRRKPGQDAAHFKKDEENGKMIVEDEDAQNQVAEEGEEDAGDDVAGQAYMDQMVSVDGFTRTATGAVKFHKNTKKRRAMDTDDGDDEVEETGEKEKRSRKSRVVKLGREFKAKKAGGDIKRPGQQDPFAYLSLREMAGKKKGAHIKYSITGRR